MSRPLGLGCCLLAWLLAGCESTQRPQAVPTPSEPSPNASILPAPLASAVEPKQRHATEADAGAPPDAGSEVNPATPRWLREHTPPEPDTLLRDPSGARLTARLRWLDLPPFPRLPESNTEAIARAREAVAFDWTIDLSPAGRLRVVFDSDAFLLPRGGELRARRDHFGHVFSWAHASAYTTLPAGAVRAALSEHRPDVAPLAKPKIARAGSGAWLGLPTEKTELTTPLGRLVLEQANLLANGTSGTLLCRLLSELVAADPSNAACERGLLPLRAEVFSRSGGHLLFEGVRLERERTFDPQALLVPPADAHFTPGDLPMTPSLILDAERTRELRVRALLRTERADPQAPKQGLLVQNRGDVQRYLLVDGVALAHVPPRSELSIDALLPGKYAVVTLDFFGDDPTPLRIVELPARIVLGDDADSR